MLLQLGDLPELPLPRGVQLRVKGAQRFEWLGTNLGSITKRGSNYLRNLLIQGAKSVVLVGKQNDPISQWAQRLRERSGWQKATVALANKNARILWAVMTENKRYDAHHVNVPPAEAMSMPA